MSSLALPWQSDRVRLRRLRPADLADFQAYRRDPEVARFQGWSPVPDADALAFLGEMHDAPGWRPGAWWQLGIAEAQTDRLVGDIGVHLDDAGREVEIGFSLSRSVQGRGLAFDAVSALVDLLLDAVPTDRIVAVTDARNAPADRLLRRLGFTHAATEAATFKGEACLEHRFIRSRQAGVVHP